MMFGPHDSESAHSARSMRWKIKRQSNDDLRQKFIDQIAPQIEFLGLEHPDPQCIWNEEVHTTIPARSTGTSSTASSTATVTATASVSSITSPSTARAPGCARRCRPTNGKRADAAQGEALPSCPIRSTGTLRGLLRSRRGLDHKHVGSLHAEDAEQALEYARDVYTRRGEGVSIWVALARHLRLAGRRLGRFFDPSNDKPYRLATYYRLPDEVDNSRTGACSQRS